MKRLICTPDRRRRAWPSPAEAQAASACAGLKPASLKAKANAAGTAVTLTWKGKRGARVAWRVVRDGKTVGQTRALKMRVRLKPGKKHTLRVTAVRRRQATACRAQYVVAAAKAARAGALGAVTALSATPVGADQLKISWGAAEAGASPIAGYRVLRDGRVVGQVKTLSTMVKIAPARVLHDPGRRRDARRQARPAVDDGHRRRRARRPDGAGRARDRRCHRHERDPLVGRLDDRPTTPRCPTGCCVTARSRSPRADCRRRSRTSSRRARVALAVQAVDSYGWTSPVSEEISFVTGHTPPGTPGTPAADTVADTRLHLSLGRFAAAGRHGAARLPPAARRRRRQPGHAGRRVGRQPRPARLAHLDRRRRRHARLRLARRPRP